MERDEDDIDLDNVPLIGNRPPKSLGGRSCRPRTAKMGLFRADSAVLRVRGTLLKEH